MDISTGWEIFGTKNANARWKNERSVGLWRNDDFILWRDNRAGDQMSHAIAEKLGVRFCGMMPASGRSYAAMYNDDHDTGGLFCVPVIHDELDVVSALDELRARFAAAK